MPENETKTTKYILQTCYEKEWSDFIDNIDNIEGLIFYAERRKRTVPKIKQRIVERITVVTEKVYVTI